MSRIERRLARSVDQLTHRVGRRVVGLFHPVRVDVQRRRRVRMPEPPAHGPHRDARRQQLRGVRVPEVVQPNTLDPEPSAQSHERMRHRIGMERAAR